MSDFDVVDTRRTEQGRLLRSGLDALDREGLMVPDGRRGVAAVVVDHTGAEVGLAFRTPREWTIEGSVKRALKKGTTVQVAGRVTW